MYTVLCMRTSCTLLLLLCVFSPWAITLKNLSYTCVPRWCCCFSEVCYYTGTTIYMCVCISTALENAADEITALRIQFGPRGNAPLHLIEEIEPLRVL